MIIRNATQSIGGAIDVEYEHPKYGWIPFTASPNDSEELGREIYALAMKSDVAPMPQPSTDEIAAKEKRIKDIADEDAAKSSGTACCCSSCFLHRSCCRPTGLRC